MTQPNGKDLRALTDWSPPAGVISVYLGFDPADRGGAWRTELRNGLDRVLDAAKQAGHEQRVALRETVRRIGARFEDGELRPPPRGEAGFVEVAEKAGEERWWGTGAPPAAAARVELGSEPTVAPLVELGCRAEARGVVLLSAERVRLLEFADGGLEQLEDLELSITSLDWRERKASSGPNPAQGVSASGHDRFEERLEHNRHRFLAECGRLAGRELEQRGLKEVVVFGPAREAEGFNPGLASAAVEAFGAGDADLISTPTGKLIEPVTAAVLQLVDERERGLVAGVLEEVHGGSRGAGGPQEVSEALAEGRVDHLVFDAAIGEPAERLVRGALGSGSEVTIVREGIAEPLAAAEGVAALLRY